MRKAEKIIVKIVGELKIIFYSPNIIYAREGQGPWVVFHKWGAPRGFYDKKWRPFRHMLLYEKSIDMQHCHRLAFRYDVQAQVTTRVPDLSNCKIEERIFS